MAHTQSTTTGINTFIPDMLDAICGGSFEKAKRAQEAGLEVRQEDDYWFCHAVNFIEGELCEFIGEVDDFTYKAGGSDCWIYPGFNPGSG
ncbi:hypothetical protein O1611_g9730 [Lasiodiplodia mahajangana]|uniref:Uncharacterized protein n=1 Tax=Lasiodiplodia mahajangana TaxID=1108764 RepID=A0ACC2J669_9PEZI|nr:hypothetical protein O1611_g9730 [Lasiodiplodia mahajangana]